MRDFELDDIVEDLQLLETIIPENYKDNELYIQNVVSTSHFNRAIDLHEIAWRYKANYNPSKFAAVQLKIKNPKVTGLIFDTGRLVLTGAVSELISMVAVQIFYGLIREIHPDILLTKLKITNIVASAQLREYIDLERILEKYPVSSHYNPSLFPGLRFTISNPKCKVLLFVKGRLLITGCSTREDLSLAYRKIIAVVSSFLSTAPIKHAVITSNRAANKKRRIEEEEDVF